MKKYRTNIVLAITFIFVFLIYLFSIISSEYSIALLLLLVILIIQIVGPRLEMRKAAKIIKTNYACKNYKVIIEYLKNKMNCCYFLAAKRGCFINLVITYMINDNVTEATKLLESYPKYKKFKHLTYVNFLLAVAEDNKENIKYYSNKLLNYNKNKIYIQQKESVKKILTMIETGQFDEEIYNNTSYPLLKRICLKVKGEDVVIDSLDVKKEVRNPLKSCSKTRNAINTLLNVLTCISIFIAMILIAIKMSSIDSLTSIDSSYYFINSIWLFYMVLPITLLNLFNGLDLKVKNIKSKFNFELGAIFSIILFLFGSSYFILKNNYTTDKNYLNSLENAIQINLADEFDIITQNFERSDQSHEVAQIKFRSVVIVSGDKFISDERWKDEISPFDILPNMFELTTSNYDKFLIYCYDSNEYNPDDYQAGYNFVVIAYDYENNNFIIYEYHIR